MIEQVLVNFATLIASVSVGTYLGAKIMKRELKKEISSYILNEVPHLLESQEFKNETRSLARVFVRELITILSEELGLKKKKKNPKRYHPNIVLFNCPRCGAPITHYQYIGADPNHNVRYYHCEKCGQIIRKPIEKRDRDK